MNNGQADCYFSADIEADGPIPGPYSMLSFALVHAGRFDGVSFQRGTYETSFYAELRPISPQFDTKALEVSGLDRNRLMREGRLPAEAMTEAARWVHRVAGNDRPVLVAYPLCFDWSWLYWYFVRFSAHGSPFRQSSAFDIKTAYAVKASQPIARSGKHQIDPALRSGRPHTHHALDDALEQADIFANVLSWRDERLQPEAAPCAANGERRPVAREDR